MILVFFKQPILKTNFWILQLNVSASDILSFIQEMSFNTPITICTYIKFSENKIILNKKFLCIDRVAFVMSRYGNTMVQYDNYSYYHDGKTMGPKKRWICNKSRRSGCRATITTMDNEVVKTVNYHNHMWGFWCYLMKMFHLILFINKIFGSAP